MLNARAVQALKIIALIASSNPSQAVNSKQLSLQLGLSVSYIESLLKILKKNELVVANRGPGGGRSTRGAFEKDMPTQAVCSDAQTQV